MHKYLLRFVFPVVVSTVSCGFPLSSSAGPGGQRSFGGASGAGDGGSIKNDQATFDRFEVMGVKLGTPLADLEGFKACVPDTPYIYPVTFYKFVDPECKAGGCMVDRNDMACGFTLNGSPRELDVIRVVLTDTPEHRVYEIKYDFPRQMLSETSTLGKSLLAKYGARCQLDSCFTGPTDSTTADSIGGGKMQWANTTRMPHSFSENPRVDVNCFPSGGYAEGGITKKCHMTVASDTILDAERAKAKR